MSSGYKPNVIAILLVQLLARLPLRMLALLGSVLGQLSFWFDRRTRRIVRRNLELCFPRWPAAQRRRVARRHFRALGRSTLCSIGMAWRDSEARLRRNVRIRGRHHYDVALETGNALILLTPHFVGLELAWLRMTLEREMVTMYREPRKHVFHWAAHRHRLRFGSSAVERNAGLRPLIRQMQEGKAFYYLPDIDPGKRTPHVFADFFGVPAATVTALGRIAHMTKAVIIPCIVYEVGWGRYDVELRAPLVLPAKASDVDNAGKMNALIEAAVRHRPEQYLWIHRRFKTRPKKGEASLYD